MPSDRSHRNLVVWAKARKLTVTVYQLTTTLPDTERFGLVSQSRRSSISVLSNIAEGAARGSRKELKQFLYVARGSLAELESQLLVASDLGFLSDDHVVFADIAEVGRMLNGLITSTTRLILRE